MMERPKMLLDNCNTVLYGARINDQSYWRNIQTVEHRFYGKIERTIVLNEH